MTSKLINFSLCFTSLIKKLLLYNSRDESGELDLIAFMNYWTRPTKLFKFKQQSNNEV